MIRVEPNFSMDTNSAIVECIKLAKKLDNGVIYFDESKDRDIEVEPYSTVYSVYKYYGWNELNE